MALATLNPSIEDIRTLGVLAYVDEAERRRIRELPSGYSARAIASLQAEVERAKKRGKL